jgi:thiol:disulfide interchange protein
MVRSSAIVLSLVLLGGCSKPSQAPVEPETASAAATNEGKTESPEARKPEGAQGVPWLHDLKVAQPQAKKQQRDLFIDISAQWCAPCQELDEVTFADPKMATIIREGYVPLKLNVTEQTDEDLALMAKFGVKLLPALLVVRDEQILLTIRSFVGPKELAAKLAEVAPR